MLDNSRSLLLSAENLWKNYGDKTVVRDVSFEISSGEVLGLLGPNGAGKTTTVGMLYGAVEPDRGRSILHPEDIPTQDKEARRSIGVITQNNNLDPDFPVFENLTVFANYHKLDKNLAKRRANELLELVGLENYAKHRIEHLSGGLQRRLVLARALIAKPRLVFLDEPTTGFDPDARQEFWKIIHNLKLSGTSLLLTTHYMDEAERLCDRLLLMQDGAVVKQGTPKQLIAEIIGAEIIEVEGISLPRLRTLMPDSQMWILPFGNSYLIQSPGENSPLWESISRENPLRLTRRRANLEDVYLLLTGKDLEGGQ